MEMRIVVPSAESATELAERLTATLPSERISLRDECPEVEILLERESDRIILHVLDAVERWLDQVGAGFAEMWLGDRSYRLARSAPLEGSQ